MDKKDLIAKAEEVIAAPSCCAELKEASQAWIDAIDTEKEAEATAYLIAELEDDVMTVDAVIAVMGMDEVRNALGAELADNIQAHAKEIKAAGAVYCDCPACTAGLSLLKGLK